MGPYSREAYLQNNILFSRNPHMAIAIQYYFIWMEKKSGKKQDFRDDNEEIAIDKCRLRNGLLAIF